MTTTVERRLSSRRDRLLRHWTPVAVVLVAFAVVSIFVLPRVEASSSARVTAYELDAGQPVPSLRIHGAVTQQQYGFVIGSYGSGSVAFDVAASPRSGERTVLLVSAGGGPDVSTVLSLVDASGRRHLLGRPKDWQMREIDVTRLVHRGRIRLEFAAASSTAAPRLIADRVQVATYRPDAIPRAGQWEVAGWVALGTLLVLVALRRLRQDAVVVAATSATAYFVWPMVTAGALQPLFSDLWDSASHASWFGLDHGLLSGTFGGRSALAVQLFHALTPITGSGTAGARTASMLVGILTVVAIYALARRATGAVDAVAAVGCALLADPFRLSLSSGDSTGTEVLAACLFLLAVYRVLERRNRSAMIVLGAVGAIAILAEPLWWPGVLATVLLLAVREVPRGRRRAALGAALAVLVLISLPSRVSVAHQSGGDLNADVIERATFARNVDFVGRDHGAPPDERRRLADPAGGPRVGLWDYVLGDHSLTTVVGRALSGAYDGLSAAAHRPVTRLAGLLAFLIELAGIVFLLLVPRLRLLVIVPAMLALVPWFFTSRGGLAPFLAQSGFWPALLVGAAVVAYAARKVARERLGQVGLLSALRIRAAAAKPPRRPAQSG